MDIIETLIDQLSDLNAAQIGELKNKLEDKWGVKAVVVSAPSVGPSVETAKPAEPTEFGVFLTGFTNKMGAIKVIREIAGLALLEAKAVVEGTLPREVKTGLAKDLADELKNKITEAGGTAEVKPA